LALIPTLRRGGGQAIPTIVIIKCVCRTRRNATIVVQKRKKEKKKKLGKEGKERKIKRRRT
jgi:hypothetical protein